MALARAFAPGKVILLGEHAVVYGQPALAGPLEQGVTVTLEPNDANGIRLQGLKGQEANALLLPMKRCAAQFRLNALDVTVEGDLPQGVGLGSSAAVSVALVRAFALAAGVGMRPQGLLDRAMELEREFHGDPSGVDHNVSFERKLIRFVKGRRGQQVILPKTVEAAVWVVEPRGSTKEKVAALRRRREVEPEPVDAIFRKIGTLVDESVAALEAGELAPVGRAMDENHRLLVELGLSTAGLDAAVRELKALGALGAKLTGAGGGGAVVGLFEDADPVVAKLGEQGRQAFVARWEQAE